MSPHTKEFILNESTLHSVVSQSELEIPLVSVNYQKEFTPQNSVFAFDLHGVIFNPSWCQIARILWQSPLKWRLMGVIFNVRIVYDAAKAVFTKKVIEQFIDEATEKHQSLSQFKEIALEFANAQKPHKKMTHLLHSLKNKGYHLIVFSNIGEKSIAILTQKYPDIFALFDNVIYTTKHDNYIAKPSDESFHKLKNRAPKNKNIIFVDDTFKNILHAHPHGIYTIPFLNVRSFKNILHESKII